jgi:hypothetical protein
MMKMMTRMLHIIVFTICSMDQGLLAEESLRFVFMEGIETGSVPNFWRNPEEFMKTNEFRERKIAPNECFTLVEKTISEEKEAKFCGDWVLFHAFVRHTGKFSDFYEETFWNDHIAYSAKTFQYSRDNKQVEYIFYHRSVHPDGITNYYFGEDGNCHMERLNEKEWEQISVDMIDCGSPRPLFRWLREVESYMKKFNFKYNIDKRVWPHKDFKKFVKYYEGYIPLKRKK